MALWPLGVRLLRKFHNRNKRLLRHRVPLRLRQHPRPKQPRSQPKRSPSSPRKQPRLLL